MMIDCNANIGPFPFRRLPLQSAKELVTEMDRLQVKQAWVGNLETALQVDPRPANDALLAAVEDYRDRLEPQPTINPAINSWERELKRCSRIHGAKSVRLFPNYHGYGLEDERVGELAEAAAAYQVAVAIYVRILDERCHPESCAVAPVDLVPLCHVAPRWPACRWIVYNARLPEALASADLFRTAPNVWLETSHLDGLGAVRVAIEQLGSASLLWGTYLPVFYAEAAGFKLREAELTASERLVITSSNAKRILARE